MKKSSWILSVSVVTALLIMVWCFTHVNEDAGEGLNVSEENEIKNKKEKLSHGNITNSIKATQLKKSLEYALKRGTEIPIEDDRMDEAYVVIDLTDEEIDLFASMIKKTTEVYWDLAPTILDETWRDETTDFHWNEKATKKINTIMEDEAVSSADLKNIDCRESLCRVQIEFPNDDTLDNFKELWAVKGPTYGQDFGKVEKSDEGQTKVTVYFSREREQRPFFEMQRKMVASLENDE